MRSRCGTQVERCGATLGFLVAGTDMARARTKVPRYARDDISKGRRTAPGTVLETAWKTQRPPRGAVLIQPTKPAYGITPAGGCCIGPAVVAAAASFQIRGWMGNNASSRRAATPSFF